MIIETSRFGELEVDDQRLIEFADGILGFPGHTRFALVQTGQDSGFYWLQAVDCAELAFVVTDQWQRHGIGTFMLKHLARIARRNGIAGFTAEVLAENKGMQTVFDHSEFKVQSKYRGDVYSYDLAFE